MRRWILIRAVVVYALALLNCCGCFGPGEIRHLADGRRIPQHWSAAVPYPGQDQATRRLRYDSLYVSEPRYLDSATTAKLYEAEWYRFFPGGQVLRKIQWTVRPPAPYTATDADEFRFGDVGRYCVVDDRLTMEFVGYGEFGAPPTFLQKRGRVNDNGSLTLDVPADSFGPATFQTLAPKYVDGMKRFPDW